MSDFYLDKLTILFHKKILSVPCTMDSSFFSQQMAPWHPNFPHQRLWLRSFLKAEVVQRGVIMCNKENWRKDLHPFILRPRFLQFLEIWFEKSGSRNLVREKRFCKIGFFSASRNVVDQKKMGLYYKSTLFQVGEKWFCRIGFFFLVWEKWLTRKKSEFAEPLF